MLYVQDGEFYQSKDDAPDLRSIECTGVEAGNVRSYQLLSEDAAILPKYRDLGAGSTALCTDTGDAYLYNKKKNEWMPV